MGYLIIVLVVALLLWGPIDDSWPAWLAIRTGYLIAIPVAAWFLLKWIWRAWQPDAASEDKLKRVLAAATGVALVVMAINAAMAHTHIGNTMWVRSGNEWESVGDDIVLPGPDWFEVVMFMAAAGFAFWFSIVKREPKQ